MVSTSVEPLQSCKLALGVGMQTRDSFVRAGGSTADGVGRIMRVRQWLGRGLLFEPARQPTVVHVRMPVDAVTQLDRRRQNTIVDPILDRTNRDTQRVGNGLLGQWSEEGGSGHHETCVVEVLCIGKDGGEDAQRAARRRTPAGSGDRFPVANQWQLIWFATAFSFAQLCETKRKLLI